MCLEVVLPSTLALSWGLPWGRLAPAAPPRGGHGGDSACGQHTQEADSSRADGVAAWDRLLVTGG